MPRKPFIGKLISIAYTDRKEPIYGFVIDYNEEWTLMKYNPVDYVIDGYILLRHKNLKGMRYSEEEKFREKVIRLKGLKPTHAETIPMNDLKTIVEYLTEHVGVFQFYTKSEKATYLGKLESIDSKRMSIRFFTPNGKWGGRMPFRPGDVRIIKFDTDYINSLKLLQKLT